MLAGRDGPEADAHTLLVALGAEHMRAVVAELEQQRVCRVVVALAV